MLLHHRDLGGAGHPPLVILHGMLGSARNWLTAGRDLAGRFHVLAVDLRNHGGSPHAEGMTYAAMVDDLLAWLDAQHLARATFLGHSLGGKVAMLLACRQAAKVERLVVVDIAPKDYHWPAHPREFAAMLRLDVEQLKSRAEAERQLEPELPDWAMRKFLATNLEQTSAGKWRWQINLPVLAAALPELERNPLAAEDRFAGPALFILGGKSAYVQPEDHRIILRHFPAARIATLPGVGHNPHIEAREEFARLI